MTRMYQWSYDFKRHMKAYGFGVIPNSALFSLGLWGVLSHDALRLTARYEVNVLDSSHEGAGPQKATRKSRRCSIRARDARPTSCDSAEGTYTVVGSLVSA